MNRIVINPGSGPVADATEAHAVKNMRHFVTDCYHNNIKCVRLPERDKDGRFGFLLWTDTRCHTIDMPGLPLEQVRYMDSPGQNIWYFPRLYVDDSSWVWKFAILNDLTEWEHVEGDEIT